MRIYQNCHEMHSEEKRNLHEMGTIVHPQSMQDKVVADDPAFRTIELSPAVFTILDGSDRDAWLRDLNLDLDWCHEDFVERVHGYSTGWGVNPGEAYKRRKVWDEFVHGGKFAYTYSERFARAVDRDADGDGWETAIERVVRELKERPDTRQAVLPVFDLTDLAYLGGRRRIPCSLHYQFTRRAQGLSTFYVMRSTDFKEHFPYDIWMGLQLQQFVASLIGSNVGPFTFFTGSLHLYAKDAEPGVF